jgi:hypothetical protein
MPWRTELISIATGTELVGADRSSTRDSPGGAAHLAPPPLTTRGPGAGSGSIEATTSESPTGMSPDPLAENEDQYTGPREALPQS